MAWWLKNNIRMIQNNIRDIDVRMDIDKQIEWPEKLWGEYTSDRMWRDYGIPSD